MGTRAQGTGEEFANAASHALGVVLVLVSLPVLAAADAPPVGGKLGLTVFLGSMLLLYLASALYHALPDGPAKGRAQRLDHAAIFVFMAGSCTPFALQGAHAGPTLALIWGLAALGAALKLRDRLHGRATSTGVYFAFGWFALLAIGPLAGHLPREALVLLLAGGAAYTVGTVFFLLDHRLRYGHLVWHLFVLGGSACHVAAALGGPR